MGCRATDAALYTSLLGPDLVLLAALTAQRIALWQGPSLALRYPVPILLGASAAASILAAIAYSPFEALRIRLISAGEDPGVVNAVQRLAKSSEGIESLFEATLPLTLLEIPCTSPLLLEEGHVHSARRLRSVGRSAPLGGRA